MRSATRVASLTVAVLSISTVNSSPPSRATVSPGRTQLLEPPRHRDEQLSPTA